MPKRKRPQDKVASSTDDEEVVSDDNHDDDSEEKEDDDDDDDEEEEESDSHSDDDSDDESISGDDSVWSGDSSSDLPEDDTDDERALQNATQTSSKSIIKHGIDKVILPPGKIFFNEIDCWSLFFDDEILELVMTHTNIEGARCSNVEWDDVDEIELHAFIGLLITISINHFNSVDLNQFWNSICTNPVFSEVMDKDRFFQVRKYLRFDDEAKSLKKARKFNDKLARIRDLWYKIDSKLKEYFHPKKNQIVNILNQNFQNYNAKNYTKGWPLAFFKTIIEIVGIASHIIWNKEYLECDSSNKGRKNYLMNLVLQLVRPNIARRRKICLSKTYEPEQSLDPEDSDAPEKQNGTYCPKRKRCYMCFRKTSRIIKQFCHVCERNVCCQHSQITCNNCRITEIYTDQENEISKRKRCFLCPYKTSRIIMKICHVCKKNVCNQHSTIICHNCAHTILGR